MADQAQVEGAGLEPSYVPTPDARTGATFLEVGYFPNALVFDGAAFLVVSYVPVQVRGRRTLYGRIGSRGCM